MTQKEFYQLYAFFNSCNESGVLESDGMNTKPILPLPTPEQKAELPTLDQTIKAAAEVVPGRSNGGNSVDSGVLNLH